MPMARVQEQPERASDNDSDEQRSGSDIDSESSSYDLDSSSSNGEEEDASEEEDAAEAEAAATAKKQRVQADIDEMRRMMADMDAIKTRLQQRLAVERHARLQRLACEDQEREEQGLGAEEQARRAARGRQVEAAVQTDTNVSQQQINVSKRVFIPPHLADGAAGAGAPLSAVDGDTGFAGAAPKKARPAGLSLYDLVKVSGVGLSRRAPPSPVRQAEPSELPTRYSNEHEQVSPEQQDYNAQPDSGEKQVSSGVNSLLSQGPDSVVGDSEDSSSHHAAVSNAARDHPSQLQTERVTSHHYDENSASVSNSLVSSSDTDTQIRQQDHKFNAAALLSTGKRVESAHNNSDSDKTDEQQEMEAIQFLLFGRGGRR